MSRKLSKIACAAAIVLFGATAAPAGWQAFVSSIYTAERTGKHPLDYAQVLTVTTAYEIAEYCMAYLRELGRKIDNGKVRVNVTLERADGTVETFRFQRRIEGEFAMSCREVGPLAPGDIFFAEFTMKNHPRLQEGEEISIDTWVAQVAP